jgi:hypothetical protein
MKDSFWAKGTRMPIVETEVEKLAAQGAGWTLP